MLSLEFIALAESTKSKYVTADEAALVEIVTVSSVFLVNVTLLPVCVALALLGTIFFPSHPTVLLI